MKRLGKRIMSSLLALVFILSVFVCTPLFSDAVSAAVPSLTISGGTPAALNSTYTANTYTGTGTAYYWSSDGGSCLYYDTSAGLWALKNQYWVYYYSTTATANGLAPTTGWMQCTTRDVLSGGTAAAGLVVSSGPAFSLSSSSYTINESVGSLSIPISLNPTYPWGATVYYTISAGTSGSAAASAGTDFYAGSGSIFVNGGESSASIGVSVIDDAIYEPDEQFKITLTGASDGATVGLGIAYITIVSDDSMPSIGFSSLAASVTENAASQSLTVSLSNPSSQAATAVLTTSNGSAAAGSDYTSLSQTVTIPAGSTSVSVPVSLTDDSVYEGNETFTATLSNPGGAVLGTAVQTVTIVDNEVQPTVSLSSSSFNCPETAGSADITVNLSAAAGLPVTVDYATSDGTAAAGSDYTSLSGTLTFTPGETSKTITVPILNDSIYEATETADITLSNPSGAALGTALASINIGSDDAMPAVSVWTSLVSCNEDCGTVNVQIHLSAVSGLPVSVDYAASDDTAAAGSDYAPCSGSLTFAPGETDKYIAVTILDSALYEGTETFHLTLSDNVNAAMGNSQTAVVITDDDTEPVISVSPVSASCTEAGGTLTFTVTLSDVSGLPVSVSYATSDGTAVSGSDYDSLSGTLIFAPGETTKDISVSVIDEQLYENPENFSILLSAPSGAALGISEAEASILDDDPEPSVSLSAASYTCTEDGLNTAVTVILSAVSGLPATVDFATLNGSAVNTEDYLAASGTLTFAPGETSKTVLIPVTDDAVYEGTESFHVNLSGPAGASLGNASAEVVISDNETLPDIGFSSPAYTVSESGGSISVPVSLSGLSAYDVDVVCEIAGTTASNGDDFGIMPPSAVLTIPAGAMSGSITIPVLQDSTHEPDEQFVITLSSPSGAALAAMQTVVTITDDESLPVVSLAVDDTNVGESDGSITLHLHLSGTSSLPMSFLYRTEGIEAASGSDFTDVIGTAVFLPGETDLYVAVPITTDSVYEGDETFKFSILTSSEVSELIDSKTITIKDDEAVPSVSLSSPALSVNESGGNIGITVTLSGLAQKDVVVSYSVSDGTAQNGSDFSGTSGTLTIPGGTLSASFLIPILNDTIFENPENFDVTLTGAGGFILGASRTRITLTSDDAAPAPTAVPTAAPVSSALTGSLVKTGESSTPLALVLLLSGTAVIILAWHRRKNCDQHR